GGVGAMAASGVVRPEGGDGSAVVDAGVVRTAAAGRGRSGGVMTTLAPRRTCGATATAAGRIWLDSTRARAGTTVAAVRFANCCLTTWGGGSAVDRAPIIVLILVMLTLVLLTLRI